MTTTGASTSSSVLLDIENSNNVLTRHTATTPTVHLHQRPHVFVPTDNNTHSSSHVPLLPPPIHSNQTMSSTSTAPHIPILSKKSYHRHYLHEDTNANDGYTKIDLHYEPMIEISTVNSSSASFMPSSSAAHTYGTTSHSQTQPKNQQATWFTMFNVGLLCTYFSI